MTERGAFAQTPETLKDWALTCQVEASTDKLFCQMSQSLFDRATNQQVLSIVIRPGEADGTFATLIGLPPGLDLSKAITFDVDGGEAGASAFQTSYRNGVYAALPLTQAAIDEMKKGTVFNVTVTTAQGREATVGASLIGFTAALERLIERSE